MQRKEKRARQKYNTRKELRENIERIKNKRNER
jgi:hypothetical protein